MDFAEKLKIYYQGKEESLKRSSFSSIDCFPDPFLQMRGYKEAIDFLNANRNEKMIVYGDYDVDGMTSTAIMVGMLKEKGITTGYFIPSHYHDGYGLNEKYLASFKEKGYKVIITVDNGIVAFEAVKKARQMGFKVMVVDHHDLQNEKLPEADVIIHPEASGYVPYNISAAFLTYLLSRGFLGRSDPYYATLAGIAVFSDVEPLKEMNYTLAKFALDTLSQHLYLQFDLLLGKKEGKVMTRDLNFQIISPLNSLARMDLGSNNNRGVRFLLSKDPSEISELGNWILKVAGKKKERMKELRNLLNTVKEDDKPVEVDYFPGLEVGLIGVAAAGRADKIQKPVFVLTDSSLDPTLLNCSARSDNGSDIFSLCLGIRDYFLAFGGHKEALGFTIRRSDFPKVRDALYKGSRNLKKEETRSKAILLNKDEISLKNIELMESYEPFGNGFSEPLFAFILKKEETSYSRDGKHILVNFSESSGLTYFSYPSDLFKDKEEVLLLGRLRVNEFRSKKKAVFSSEKEEQEKKVELIG